MTNDSTAPILFKPPPPSSNSQSGKRKLHYLERTDPNFKKDLATSVKHVAYVVQQLQAAIDNLTVPSSISNIHLTQLETVCRETVSKRRLYADKGDVEVSWTQDNIPCKAILEVKQRKKPAFTALSNFPYPTIITDEKRLFDKIRVRGDTIGYLVTNHDKSVFLFVDYDTVENTYTTHTAPDRWKGGRERTYLDVPTEQFVEGVNECAIKMVQVLTQFAQRTGLEQKQLLIKMGTENLVKLRTQLQTAHKTTERIRRAIDTEELKLSELQK